MVVTFTYGNASAEACQSATAAPQRADARPGVGAGHRDDRRLQRRPIGWHRLLATHTRPTGHPSGAAQAAAAASTHPRAAETVTMSTASPDPPQPPTPAVLEMQAIDKSFPGVHALRSSTSMSGRARSSDSSARTAPASRPSMKILSGAYDRDAGQILVDGEAVEAAWPARHARAAASRSSTRSRHWPRTSRPAENIFMGRLPTHFAAGWWTGAG